MDKPIRGLHHVTATVSDAQADLDFYVGVLGQRLVKKTVNFDNHDVYHFYYGNESGAPGTIMTTFPYKQMGVRVGTHGAGQITMTSFSVPAGSLAFWRRRLTAAGVAFTDEASDFGEEALRFSDPSGLTIRLVESEATTARRGGARTSMPPAPSAASTASRCWCASRRRRSSSFRICWRARSWARPPTQPAWR